MTIVRLRLTGVGPGTSRSTVRLHGIGSGSCHSTRTDPNAAPDATGVAIGEASRIPTVAGPRRVRRITR
jgi:hypothetical protein